MCIENLVPEDAPENECLFCGEPCQKTFCNKRCYLEYIADNETD